MTDRDKTLDALRAKGAHVETRYQRIAREQRERQEARAVRQVAEARARAKRARQATASARAGRLRETEVGGDHDTTMNG